MAPVYDGDLIGYGPNPPDPKWPNGARLAVNFVMNYEEGSEPSVQDGEGYSETGLTESHGVSQGVKGRDLAAETMFEYGSRVGFWRLMRLFQDRQLPLTIFGCALALERHPPAAEAIRKAGFDVCSHGWRWVKHYQLTRRTEREHIARAIASLRKTVGERPLGWLCFAITGPTRSTDARMRLRQARHARGPVGNGSAAQCSLNPAACRGKRWNSGWEGGGLTQEEGRT
jgi:allantoinase